VLNLLKTQQLSCINLFCDQYEHMRFKFGDVQSHPKFVPSKPVSRLLFTLEDILYEDIIIITGGTWWGGAVAP